MFPENIIAFLFFIVNKQEVMTASLLTDTKKTAEAVY